MSAPLDDVRTAMSVCNDIRSWEEPMQTEVSKRVNETRLALLEILRQAELKLITNEDYN